MCVYAYANGNPLSYNDPKGENALWIALAAAAAGYKAVDYVGTFLEARDNISDALQLRDLKALALRVCVEQGNQGACALAHQAQNQLVECAAQGVAAGANVESLGNQSPIEALKTGLERIGR